MPTGIHSSSITVVKRKNRKYRPGEQPLLDRWTGGHAAVGVLYGSLTKMPWWTAFGLAIAWEVFENPIKDRYPRFFPDAKHDTYANAAMDAAAVTLGFCLGRRYVA